MKIPVRTWANMLCKTLMDSKQTIQWASTISNQKGKNKIIFKTHNPSLIHNYFLHLTYSGAFLPLLISKFLLLSQFSKFQNQMLRLNLYCSLVSSPRQAKAVCNFSSLIQYKRIHTLHGRFAVKALKDEMDGGSKGGGAPGQSWDPGLEFEVPFEQRPVCFL